MADSSNTNWLAIKGNVEMNNSGRISLRPSTASPASPNAAQQTPEALVKSNMTFDRGRVKLRAHLADSESSCQVIFGADTSTEIFAGINVWGAPYGIAVRSSNRWEAVATSGHESKLAEGVYDLEIRVEGSDIDLYINDVRAAFTTHQFSHGPISLGLKGLGDIYAENICVEPEKPVCFVVMEFSDDYNALYSHVIEKVCESAGFNVLRADYSYKSGLIIEDITRLIRRSTVVIADVTPNNANVFYEIGYAHGIGKPTILMSDRRRDKLPFDISGFRTLFYENSIQGKSTLEDGLKLHLDAIATPR